MKLGYLSKMVLFVKQMVLKMKLVVLIRENTQIYEGGGADIIRNYSSELIENIYD